MKRAATISLVLVSTGLVLSGLEAQPQAPHFVGTALEQEAYRLYHDDKPLAARAKAEEVLRYDPDSIVGNYVMGAVLREAEGSLARAMFHLGHAREIYEMRWGTERPAGAPWQLHREVLHAIQQLAGEMEQYAYQLQILEFYDSLYDPDLTAEHAWPLLHLGRFAEARFFAQNAARSSDEWQQSLGLNSLCAIEGEARQRQAHHQACLAALDRARRRRDASSDSNPLTAPHVTVHAYNAAIGAASILRHDEVERLALEGTRRLEFTTANPWRLLALLYADEGKMDRAVEALREMQRWRTRQPAHLRDQDHADNDATVATIMLLAGEIDTGLGCISRAIEHPDRRGLTSSRPEQALGAHALLRRAILRARAETIAERASWSGTVGRVSGSLEALSGRVQAWPDDERIASVLSDDDRLISTLRVHVHGGIEPVPTWLVGDLVEILGAGVVSVALARARVEDAAMPALVAYYDAIEAEVALAQGEGPRSLAFAQSALAHLPAAEPLLGARVAAVGAIAAAGERQDATALALLERAMQRDPGVLRRMGIAVPAVIRLQAAGPAAERAATLLARSPRFDEADSGFVVSVEQVGAALRACIRSPQGALLGACADAAPVRNEAPEDWGARLVAELHRTAFSIRSGLTSTDLRSLDGSTTTASEAMREQMRGVLDDIAREQGRQ
ncbi:MAG: hypothetical protein HYY06_22130 [Deltaproteobacteria bacterium]|nr:hypothetical protein [Deltaproteobacteria bacterium]